MFTTTLCLVHLALRAPEQVTFVRFISHGKQLFIAHGAPQAGSCPGGVEIFDARSGKKVRSLPRPINVAKMLLSPDEKWFATGGEGQGPLELRSTQNGHLIRRFEPVSVFSSPGLSRQGAEVPATGLSVAPALVISKDGHLQPEGSKLPEEGLRGVPGSEGAALLAADPVHHRVAIWTRNYEISLTILPWPIKSKVQIYMSTMLIVEQEILLPNNERLGSLSFSPSGRLVMWRSSGQVEFWDAGSATLTRSLACPPPMWGSTNEQAPIFSENEKRMALRLYDEGVAVYDLTGHRKPFTIRAADPEAFLSVDISPNGGMIAIGTTAGTVQIRNAQTGKLVRRIRISGGR